MDEPTDGPTDQVQRIPLYFYCVYCFSSINSVRITPRSHLGASSNSKLSWLMSYSSSARGPKCRIVCRFMRPSDNLLAITNVALYVDLRVCQSICMAVVWSHVISLAFWVNCFFFKNDFGFHGYDGVSSAPMLLPSSRQKKIVRALLHLLFCLMVNVNLLIWWKDIAHFMDGYVDASMFFTPLWESLTSHFLW